MGEPLMTREETHLASGATGNPEPLQIRVACDEAQVGCADPCLGTAGK